MPKWHQAALASEPASSASLNSLCARPFEYVCSVCSAHKVCWSLIFLVHGIADHLINSELKKDFVDNDGTWKMGLWVYETDLQKPGVEVYKSNMSWPNKEHATIYICLGDSQQSQTADRRCLVTDMLVVFTDRFHKGQRHSDQGYLVKLPVRGYNSYLSAKVIEDKSKLAKECDTACKVLDSMFDFIFGWGGLIVLGIFGALLILGGIMACCEELKREGQNSSVVPTTTDQGESLCKPHSILYIIFACARRNI